MALEEVTALRGSVGELLVGLEAPEEPARPSGENIGPLGEQAAELWSARAHARAARVPIPRRR